MAIAASNMTAALGYVICERAKKDEVPRSRYRAHLVCRYKPNDAHAADHMITTDPRRIPICDIARGIANVPAPITADLLGPAITQSGRGALTGVDEVDVATHP